MLKLLIVVLVFAAVTYFVTRALQERGFSPTNTHRPQLRRPAPRRPVAPDDDEDFLRELERKKRQQKPPEDGSAA